jgi:predicted ferric reductase
MMFLHFFIVPKTEVIPPGAPIGMGVFYGFIVIVFITLSPRLPIFDRLIRLAYHRWRWIHRLIGLFFVGAYIHMLLVNPLVLSAPVPFAYMTLFYALGVGSYLYTELATARLRPRPRHTVERVTRLNGNTVEVALRPQQQKLPFRAGQFLFVSFDNDKTLRESHPFTISSAPGEDLLRLSIKASGDYTGYLNQHLREGMSARVEGPYGLFNYRTGGREQVWVAGGIGITPFLSWARDFSGAEDYIIDLFYSVRSREEALFLDELNDICLRHPFFRVYPVFSVQDGNLTLERITRVCGPDLRSRHIYLCGPIKMMYAFESMFRKVNVPAGQIHYEEFNFK